MPADNFENNVKKSMDELRFQPSEKVWTNVQSGIQTGKRKRRAFYFYLPAAAILVAFIGYYVLQDNTSDINPASKDSASSATASSVPSIFQEADGHPTENNVKAGVEKDNSIQDLAAITSEPNQSSATESKANEETSVAYQPNAAIQNIKQVTIKPEVGNQLKISKANPSNLAVSDHSEHVVAIDNSLLAAEENLLAEKIQAYVKLSLPAFKPTDFSGPSAEINQVKELNAYMKELPDQKSASRLKWGITASANNTGIFSGNIMNSEMQSFDNANLVFSGSFTSMAPVLYQPDRMKSSSGFTAGVFAEKDLSERIAISAGLNFSTFSTQLHVGVPVLRDTTVTNYSGLTQRVNTYFSPERKKSYTNRFNLLEMPLSLKCKAIDSKVIPITINGGVSLAYLLNTNALHFDTFQGIYYEDESLFNKWHGFFNAGISTEIFRNSGTPVSIGPSANFMFSKLIPDNSTKPQHLFSFGVKADLYLKGKQ